MLKTGFGRVNAEAALAFQSKGWEVASLGGLTDGSITPTSDYGAFYAPSGYNGDVWGFHDAPGVIEDFRPDVVYTTCDPGTFVTASSVIPDGNRFLGYVPIEGEPIAQRDWRKMLGILPFFTCTDYGTKVVKRYLGKNVDYVYHGVDHEVFNTAPRDNGMRDAVRKQMKWEGKFVVGVVATNVRRKQIPRIIEAMSILKHQYKQKDIVLYLHTVPYQHYWLDGWNLPEVAEMYGVQDITFFNPLMHKFNANVPELTGEPKNPGLAEIYNSLDLFVSASQVEGFGLPTAEAMACGVPVVVPKYAAGWEVASPAGVGLPIIDWEVHKSSTRYGNVDPQDIAKAILRIKRNPNEAQRMSKAGLSRVQDYQWSNFRTMVINKVEEVVNGDQSSNTVAEASDPRPQEEDGAGRPNQVGSGEASIQDGEL